MLPRRALNVSFHEPLADRLQFLKGALLVLGGDDVYRHPGTNGRPAQQDLDCDVSVAGAEAGLSRPLPPDDASDAALARMLFRRMGRPPRDLSEPDWPYVAQELKRKSVTLTLLWQEYRAAHPEGLRLHLVLPTVRHLPAPGCIPTFRHRHEAGAVMQRPIIYAFMARVAAPPSSFPAFAQARRVTRQPQSGALGVARVGGEIGRVL